MGWAGFGREIVLRSVIHPPSPGSADGQLPHPVPQQPSHKNNFGLLRLGFAMLVIVSHSIELLDGNPAREPIHYIFGTWTSGGLGVDGFFLVSGFLITQSFERSASTISYIWKRILRIYPAFIVASVLSLLVFGPLSGADLSALGLFGWIRAAAYIVLLAPPTLPDSFIGQHYRDLNGAMWTIAYEFRCYLVIMLIGLAGGIRNRTVFAILIVIFLLAVTFGSSDSTPSAGLFNALFGSLPYSLRFGALFLVGSGFYIFRDMIPYRNDLAIIALLMFCGFLFSLTTARFAVPVFGGYLVFWFAFLPNTPMLNTINTTTDISYGTYLYAWPIQNLLIRHISNISLWQVIALTVIGSSTLALLSWNLIEKPSLKLKSRTVFGTAGKIVEG
jgi:peptidoglycan/LPS O-acetylase OafA/YrhL